MRRFRIVLIVSAIIAVVAAGGWTAVRHYFMPTATAAPLDLAHAATATQFLDRLDRGEYDAAHAMLAPAAREKLTRADLEKVWTGLPEQLGKSAGREGPRGESVNGRPVVTYTLKFANMSLDARISVDAQAMIDGFRLVPSSQASPAPPPAGDAPYSERDIALGPSGHSLPGTLTMPKGAGPFPAVVLVHGSGPQDRDETIGPNKPFLEIARGLASEGIAVLRYEKRTRARPEDFSRNDYTVDVETVDDAVAAVDLLRGTAGIDPQRVFVVGHSLGAMMAPRIASRAPRAAGLVLMAPPARPLEDIVVEQARYMAAVDGKVDAAEQKAIDELSAQRDAIKSLRADSPPAELMLMLPKPYWLDLQGYDPVGVAGAIPQRILVVQGDRDIQVTAPDIERWQSRFGSDARVTIKRYGALNHLFIAGAGAGRPDEYFKPGHVDEQVISDVAAWIKHAQRAG